jgi:hypothetical protein
MALRNENSSVPSQLRTYGDIATRVMFHQTVLNGGTTVSLETFKVPAQTDGYFVGAATGWNGKDIPAHIIPVENFTLESLRRAFGHLYADHLTREEIENSMPVKGGYIGTWTEDGLVHIDAVSWTPSYFEAVQWAVQRGEMAIWDVKANGSLETAEIAPIIMGELISA